MNSKVFKISVFAAALLFVTGMNSQIYAQEAESYAEIIHVEDIKEMVDGSREVCEDVSSTEKAQPKDKKKVAGTLIGAVAGGVLGHQVGGGRGKTLATIAGATAGGVAGNKVQGNAQDQETVTTTNQKCRIVEGSVETVVGYNITYKLDGKASTIRTEFKPEGNRIPVKNGKLVFEH